MSAQRPGFRLINPPALVQPVGYSQVAEVIGGRTIYISGQIALDQAGNLVGAGDLRAQTHQVFANLSAALEAVGADFSAVVKLNFYMVDISQIPVVREIRDQFVNVQRPPTSSAVEVRRLVRDDLLIEIDAVAVISDLNQKGRVSDSPLRISTNYTQTPKRVYTPGASNSSSVSVSSTFSSASSSSCVVTLTIPARLNLPDRMPSESASSISFWIRRRSGRAPYSGS